MTMDGRCGWISATAAAWLVAVPAGYAGGQESIPEIPEPFDEIPEGLRSAALEAVNAVDWLKGGTLEYVVITTSKGSRIFKLADIPESLYKLEEIQDPEEGKVVRIPRWSAETGKASLVDPIADDIEQFIVIVTSSPGSGNDCRRGGSCRGADRGGGN